MAPRIAVVAELNAWGSQASTHVPNDEALNAECERDEQHAKDDRSPR
jgi:hypothetical protein